MLQLRSSLYFLLVFVAAAFDAHGLLSGSSLATSRPTRPQAPNAVPALRGHRPPTRRPPARGPRASSEPTDEPPHPDWGTWDASHAAGQRWLGSLRESHHGHHNAHARRPKEPDKPVMMGQLHCSEPRATVRWTPFPEVTQQWHTPLGPSAHNRYQAVSVRRAAGRGGPLSSLVLYHNSFDARRGVLLLESNWRVYDRGPPPRPHLSDVLRHCYGAAEDRAGGRHGRRGWANAVPPRYVVQLRIVARCTTTVLREAHERRRAPRETIQRWKPGDEEFVVLMGSAHGKTAIHMLRDFGGWAEHRTVVGVATVYAVDPMTTRAGWYMLIELGGGPAEAARILAHAS